MRGAFLEAILRWSSRAVVAEIRHDLQRSGAGTGKPVSVARRPRAGSHPASGRPWGPDRSYYEGPPSVAARVWDEGRRKPAGCGSNRKVRYSQPEERVQGHKTPQVERRMASVPKGTSPPRGGLQRPSAISALHPLTFEGSLSCEREAKRRGPARGRPNSTGDDARLERPAYRSERRSAGTLRHVRHFLA